MNATPRRFDFRCRGLFLIRSRCYRPFRLPFTRFFFMPRLQRISRFTPCHISLHAALLHLAASSFTLPCRHDVCCCMLSPHAVLPLLRCFQIFLYAAQKSRRAARNIRVQVTSSMRGELWRFMRAAPQRRARNSCALRRATRHALFCRAFDGVCACCRATFAMRTRAAFFHAGAQAPAESDMTRTPQMLPRRSPITIDFFDYCHATTSLRLRLRFQLFAARLQFIRFFRAAPSATLVGYGLLRVMLP